MADLITRARALHNLNNRATTEAEDDTLDALISAVSRAIERFCWRTFAVATFDELHRGTRRTELVLRSYPLASVERVAYAPGPALEIANTSATVQRATVKVTATGLELIRVASGVATTSTLLFSDQPTLTALAAAVTALGNGWSASVVAPVDGLRASADLRALQGAFPCRDRSALLHLHLQELAGFHVDAEHGILTRAEGAVWQGGLDYWRIVYRAGYASVPEDVQEACAQWVAMLFWQTKRDPGLGSETLPGVVARAPLRDLPLSLHALLRPYRNWRV